MELLKANHKNILKAAELIKKGNLVAFPTETVYGLGADGLNPLAVAKIFEVKKRPAFNPLILHISNLKQLGIISESDNPDIKKLIDSFWPGPLTLVLPKKDVVPDIVTAGNETVAIRMPNHPTALELIDLVGNPIAAPSANIFGHLSPTSAEHVVNQLGNKVDLVLDGGTCMVGIESTIIAILENRAILLRPGGTATEEIEKIIGPLGKNINTFFASPISPGQLPYHYAPKIPIRFIDKRDKKNIDTSRAGLLLFTEKKVDYPFKIIRVLTHNSDLREAAANLFSCLHEMEATGIDEIYVESVPEVGLGIAIMDRLRKATNKYES